MSIQPFTLGVDGPEIGCLMEVSFMFDIYLPLPQQGTAEVGTGITDFIMSLELNLLPFIMPHCTSHIPF